MLIPAAAYATVLVPITIHGTRCLPGNSQKNDQNARGHKLVRHEFPTPVDKTYLHIGLEVVAGIGLVEAFVR